MPLPRFIEARIDIPAPRLEDVPGTARQAARRLVQERGLRAGAAVVVTAGSRGIHRIGEITGVVVDELGQMGMRPLIVPAMGSHGGGTAEGQMELAAEYGVSQAAVGAPVRSSMEVERLGDADSGCPVHFDRIALAADGVIVLNRIKPHTILRGEQGSGIVKMLSIGLGKHVGAQTIHNAGLEQHVTPVARALLGRTPVIGGIALVENGLGETASIDAVTPDAYIERDRELLRTARGYMPHLPVLPLDVLVVRRMGKNLSGTGMDPNVIGMHRRLGGEPDVDISTIVALDLTDESHGNAIGVGMADLITHRLRDKIDWKPTSVNALTSGFLGGMKLPFALPTERDALETAVSPFDPATVRMAIIDDTLHLTRIWLSESLRDEAVQDAAIHMAGTPRDLVFTGDGALGL